MVVPSRTSVIVRRLYLIGIKVYPKMENKRVRIKIIM